MYWFLTPLPSQLLVTVYAQCNRGHTARFGPAHAPTPVTSAIITISIADKHNPSPRVNSSITDTTQSNIGDSKKTNFVS